MILCHLRDLPVSHVHNKRLKNALYVTKLFNSMQHESLCCLENKHILLGLVLVVGRKPVPPCPFTYHQRSHTLHNKAFAIGAVF